MDSFDDRPGMDNARIVTGQATAFDWYAHRFYNGCRPTTVWVEAPMFKLAARALSLTVVVGGASVVLADELIVVSLIVATTVLAAAILVMHPYSTKRAPSMSGYRTAGDRRGPATV